jgi:hypothetical protein
VTGIDVLPATTRRVEQHTRPEWNELNRLRTHASVSRLQDADRAQIDARLAELDREWDIERLLNANAGTLLFASALIGRFVDRRALWLTAAVGTFFAQHALNGWCPPVPVFRRYGMRTMREIERERYAIKALRGDFGSVPAAGVAAPSKRVEAALAAVDA